MTTTEAARPETVQFGMPFINAIAYAADAHNGQVRKGSNIPYLSHPLAVAALVLEYGGDEELAIAGLLHDVIEDCDPVFAERMQETFGGRVYSIVFQLTDGVPGDDGEKPEWKPRKDANIAKMRDAKPDVLLVAACDKLHNARCLLADIQREGLAAFDKFKGGVDGTIWYLLEMGRATSSTEPGAALLDVTAEITRLVDHLRAN